MKKHHSNATEPRGRIVSTLRKPDLFGIEIPGYNPLILVQVKTGSRKQVKAFIRFCERNGIIYRVAGVKKEPKQERWYDSNGNEIEEPEKRPTAFTTYYEVSGGPALEELTELPCVVSWHYPLHVGAPHFTSKFHRRRY